MFYYIISWFNLGFCGNDKLLCICTEKSLTVLLMPVVGLAIEQDAAKSTWLYEGESTFLSIIYSIHLHPSVCKISVTSISVFSAVTNGADMLSLILTSMTESIERFNFFVKTHFSNSSCNFPSLKLMAVLFNRIVPLLSVTFTTKTVMMFLDLQSACASQSMLLMNLLTT